MSVISVVSMKGGVGKTTLTANLAVALAARLGKNRVAVIDFDPRSSLPWHIGLGNFNGRTAPPEKGLVHISDVKNELKPESITDITTFGYHSESGVVCLPFGDASEVQRKSFEKMLQRKASWLSDLIENAKLDRDYLVLIDTPPGHSVYQQQALKAADLSIAVLLPDAASYATLASMESEFSENPSVMPSVYVVNQYDQRQALCIDVVKILRQDIGERLVPILISQDEGVREALALQKTCMQYDPHSQASHDIDQLSQWLVTAINRGHD